MIRPSHYGSRSIKGCRIRGNHPLRDHHLRITMTWASGITLWRARDSQMIVQPIDEQVFWGQTPHIEELSPWDPVAILWSTSTGKNSWLGESVIHCRGLKYELSEKLMRSHTTKRSPRPLWSRVQHLVPPVLLTQCITMVLSVWTRTWVPHSTSGISSKRGKLEKVDLLRKTEKVDLSRRLISGPHLSHW